VSQHKNLVDEFKYVFYPRSIAVFGATSDQVFKINIANRFINTLLDFGYSGSMYPVGNSGGEVRGLKIYTAVNDIPDEVDFAIAVIPNKLVPQMMEDCGRKGVKIVHLFVSGFEEIEDKIGTALQSEILKIAAQYKIRLVGPNCMGVYCPASRMTFAIGYSPVVGKVGYLSQSGGQSIMGIKEANRRGIYFSKVVSYGNAADINECDLIEYFTDDPETDIITAYIEGTNHGPRLLRALKAANMKKPVVLFKCADTQGGSQAAVSHTSAIAGSSRTWDALIRQTGVIRVYNIKEMFDVVTVLQRCPEPQGLSTLLVGHGGGSCVQASDDCCRAGLKMPVLPIRYRQALKDIYKSEAGNIFKNPLDINPYWGLEKAKEAFAAVSDWDGADVIVLLSTPEQTPFMPREWEYEVTTQAIMEWAKLSTKPTVLAMNVHTMPGEDGLAEKCFNQIANAGFAVFPSARRAATALERVFRYNQWRKKHS
jgi:acyl-CoA synthetase (NDP forming)